MGKTLCFSGHRPNRLGGFYGERAEIIQKGIGGKLVQVIHRTISAGYDTFISGGALGVDQIAAETVLYVKANVNSDIKLIIAVPFPSQHKKWPPKSQERYLRILKAADEVVHCSEDPYSAAKMQIRNEWMVDQSNTIIAVWNGGKGGTYNCIQYTVKMCKPILLINPYTLTEKWRMSAPKRIGRW